MEKLINFNNEILISSNSSQRIGVTNALINTSHPVKTAPHHINQAYITSIMKSRDRSAKEHNEEIQSLVIVGAIIVY